MRDLGADNKLKAVILEDLLVAGFGARQLEKLLVRLEDDDARVGLCPLAQGFAAITEAPAEVQQNISVFELQRRVKPTDLAQRVVCAVIRNAIHFDGRLPGS